MDTIFKDIVETIESGKEAALCIIIKSSGSTPRKAGTKMLVFPTGKIKGTIGGGSLEQLVIQKALDLIPEAKKGVFDFNLTEAEGMACGGFAQVYIETLQHQQQLIIFGAGHIGKALAPMAKQLGFGVTFVDEREGIFEDINAGQYSCINKNYNLAIEDLNINSQTYICVMTHSHEMDKEIVARCGKQQWAYLGMIGSKRKIETIKREFLEHDVLTKTEMEKINWPMGVSINCQTPQEIAVSVLAKLVDVRASK